MITFLASIKFLRLFNFVVFLILFVMGIVVFFAFYDRLNGYLNFADMVARVFVPMIIAGAVGSPVKKWIESLKIKAENGK